MEPRATNSTSSTNNQQSLLDLASILHELPSERMTNSVKESLSRLLGDEPEHNKIVVDYLFGEELLPPTKEVAEQIGRLLVDDASIVRENIVHVKDILLLFHPSKGPRQRQDFSSDSVVAKLLPASIGKLSPFKDVYDDVLRLSIDLTKNQPRNVRAEIAVKSLREMRSQDRGAMLGWLDKISTYDGSCSLLHDFLTKAGTYNPYIATKVMRLIIKRAAAEDVSESDVLERRDQSSSDSPVVIGQVASGGSFLTKEDDHYLAYREDRLENTFARKRQAILKIYSIALSTEELAAKKSRRSKVKEDVAEQAFTQPESIDVLVSDLVGEIIGNANDTIAALKDVTLDQYLESEELQRLGKHSPILSRNTELYKELLAEIEQLKKQRVDFIGGERLIHINAKNHDQTNLLKSPGGTVMNIVGRALVEQPELVPEHVQLAYKALVFDEIEIPPASEKLYYWAIYSWVGRHVYIERDLALNDFKDDVGYFLECQEHKEHLPLDHPIHSVDSNLQAFLNDYEWLLKDNSEVPLYQVLQVQLDSRILGFRAAVNEYHYKLYEDQLNQAIDKLRVFFQVNIDGVWHYRPEQDKPSGGINRDGIRNTLYGFDFNHAAEEPEGKPHKRVSPLLDREWAAIKRFLDLSIFEESQDKVTFKAYPIARFEALLNRAVIAGAKAKYVDGLLSDKGVDLHGKKIEELSGLEIEEYTADISPDYLLKGSFDDSASKLRAASILKLPEYLGESLEDRLRELVARASACYDYQGAYYGHHKADETVVKNWRNFSFDLHHHGRVGLVVDKKSSSEVLKYLEDLSNSREIEGLVEVDQDIDAKISFAIELLENPLVRLPGYVEATIERLRSQREKLSNEKLVKWYSKAYITAYELDSLNELLELKDQIKDFLESSEDREVAEEKVRAFMGKTCIYPSDGTTLDTYKIDSKRFQSVKELSSDKLKVELADLSDVVSMCDKLEQRFVSSEEIKMRVAERDLALLDTVYNYMIKRTGLYDPSRLVVEDNHLVSIKIANALPEEGKDIGSGELVWSKVGDVVVPVVNLGDSLKGRSVFDPDISAEEFSALRKSASTASLAMAKIFRQLDNLRQSEEMLGEQIESFKVWYIANYPTLIKLN